MAVKAGARGAPHQGGEWRWEVPVSEPLLLAVGLQAGGHEAVRLLPRVESPFCSLGVGAHGHQVSSPSLWPCMVQWLQCTRKGGQEGG